MQGIALDRQKRLEVESYPGWSDLVRRRKKNATIVCFVVYVYITFDLSFDYDCEVNVSLIKLIDSRF